MPYNPGVIDQSGQILGQGIASFGQSIGQGIERGAAKKEQEQNILQEANGRGKALQTAFKSLEDLGIVPAGFSDKIKAQRENTSPREFLALADAMSKEFGTIVQGGVMAMKQRSEEEQRKKIAQAMASTQGLDPVIQAGIGAGIEPGQVAALSNANTNAIEAQRPKERPIPAAMQEIEARLAAEVQAGVVAPVDVAKKRAEYYAQAAEKTPATSINLGNDMKKEAFKSFLAEKNTNMMPLLSAQPTLESMDAMLNAVDDKGKIITGAFSKMELGTKRLLNGLGLTNFKDVAATQAYLGNAVRLTGQIIKDFGAGTALSDADREYAAKAAAGDLTMDKAALQRLAKAARKVMSTRMDNYNKTIEDTFSDGDAESKLALRALRISAPKSAAEQTQSLFDQADAIINQK